MTREEAIAIIENEKRCVNRASKNDDCNRDCYNCELVKTDAEILEALDMAIKAMEQDSILDKIKAEMQNLRNCSCGCSDGIIDDVEDIIDKYKAESEDTVNKTGHWIDIMVGDMPAQACDQCNTFYPLAYTGGGHKYCPNCGIKMSEKPTGSESEDEG